MEQSNVTRLPSRPASQPGPDPLNPIARLVQAIDKALGDKWSFDLVHHEVVGDETVVFTRLTRAEASALIEALRKEAA